MLKIKFQYTDIGHRDENLDRFGHIDKENWSLSYVIDGFEINSPHYVDTLKQQIDNINCLSNDCSEMQIIEAISNAISFEGHFSGKASVAIVICLQNKMITLTAGDTRVYQLTSLKRTIDHSRAQEMIDIGKANANSLYRHPLRKYLIRKLEPRSKFTDLIRTDHENIESIMLCSDGLWSCFNSDDEIYRSISKGHDILIEQALSNRRINRDNITVLWLELS